jgi:hypothetical protein
MRICVRCFNDEWCPEHDDEPVIHFTKPRYPKEIWHHTLRVRVRRLHVRTRPVIIIAQTRIK